MFLLIALLQFLLTFYCLRDIFRSKFKDGGAKLIWILIVVFAPLLGSLAYLQNRKHLKFRKRFIKNEREERVF